MATKKSRAKDPTRKKTKELLARLGKAKREEDVKAAWARCFGLEYDTADDHDLYTEQVLFEFKHQRNFDQPAQRAATLAQLLYYVRRLKLSGTAKGIPAHFCLADRATAVIGDVAVWRELYTDAHGRYDWDLRPSSPDPLLVAAVQAHERFGRSQHHSGQLRGGAGRACGAPVAQDRVAQRPRPVHATGARTAARRVRRRLRRVGPVRQQQ